MNGDMLEHEVGELIEGTDVEKGTPSCKAHIHHTMAIKKSLRLSEVAIRLHKWSIGLMALSLISIWIKGGAVSDIVSGIIGILVKSSIGETP